MASAPSRQTHHPTCRYRYTDARIDWARFCATLTSLSPEAHDSDTREALMSATTMESVLLYLLGLNPSHWFRANEGQKRSAGLSFTITASALFLLERDCEVASRSMPFHVRPADDVAQAVRRAVDGSAVLTALSNLQGAEEADTACPRWEREEARRRARWVVDVCVDRLVQRAFESLLVQQRDGEHWSAEIVRDALHFVLDERWAGVHDWEQSGSFLDRVVEQQHCDVGAVGPQAPSSRSAAKSGGTATIRERILGASAPDVLKPTLARPPPFSSWPRNSFRVKTSPIISPAMYEGGSDPAAPQLSRREDTSPRVLVSPRNAEHDACVTRRTEEAAVSPPSYARLLEQVLRGRRSR